MHEIVFVIALGGGMRNSAATGAIKVRAIAGTYVVALGWDFITGQPDTIPDLMGFALERLEVKDGQVIERYFLQGIKRFKDKDMGLPPGTPVSTREHPFQSFQWGDYTVKPGKVYRYRIVPVRGTVKHLQLDDAAAGEVEIATEVEYLLDPNQPNNKARHDVYFNRGVIGSQAYARRFQNAEPDSSDPTSPEMKWLSRGLFEALLRFIALAEDHRFALRAALYEFHYQPVANAFAKQIEAGADVKIVYDAESNYKTENEATIGRAGLADAGAVIPRTVSDGIRHNKFIVLLEDDVPVAVWTGSTNISDGGLFGHSNVGHIVWDGTVAKAYLKYWKRLADNLTPGKLREPNTKATPLPQGKPPAGSVTPLFSARDPDDKPSRTLQWYADRMDEATEIVCFTVAFNVDAVFQKVLSKQNDVVRYVVKDDDLGDGEIIEQDRDLLFAAGGYLGSGALANFLRERDNPLNSNDYIHDKFMLIDPLGEDPTVITGSANFSQPSQIRNDENMLVIRSDKRVADIYFGEFMRMFDHHYARYLVKKLKKLDKQDPDAGYLKSKASDWLPPHFDPNSYKSKRRRYFVGT